MKIGEARRRIKELEEENATLRQIAQTLQICAKRYADGRRTYAVYEVNECTEKLIKMGVKLNPGAEETFWAKDGDGRRLDELSDSHFEPGNPLALAHVWGLPPQTRLDEKLVELLGTSKIEEAVERLMVLLEIEQKYQAERQA